jgi:heterodisulfide reductase subunit A-like polyferredoxin
VDLIIFFEGKKYMETSSFKEQQRPLEHTQRVGVYVCRCGHNIGKVVDCARVAQMAASLAAVKVAKEIGYACSDPGQQEIRNDIAENNLDRIVVASCSPRLHEPTFRKMMLEAGLNPYMLEMANLREQCSWVHMNLPEDATEKAFDLVKMAVARANLLEPLYEETLPLTKRTLVIGGGVAGIQAALDLADNGYEVVLVEKRPSIGGIMAQLDKTFPTMDCSI